MAYANLTPNLQDMFAQINDRLRKLESGPNSAAYAASSAQSTADTAYITANAAQTSANGKNTIHYSTGTPGSTANQVGDIWYQYDGSNHVIAQWSGAGGTSWTSTKLSGLVLTNLDAGSITTGTISSIVYNNGSGTFSVAADGTLNASKGTVGGWTLNSSYFTDGGTTFLYPTSTATSPALSTLAGVTAGYVQVGSSHPSGSTYSLFVPTGATTYLGGAITTGNQLTVAGNLQVQTMSSTSATGVVWSSSNSRFYLTTSTERHKDNITPIPASDYLAKLLQLEPVTFNYKPEFTDNPNQVISGLIAEKVAAIPEFSTVVNLDAEGQPESLAYDRLAVFILPALKQLNDRLTVLEAK